MQHRSSGDNPAGGLHGGVDLPGWVPPVWGGCQFFRESLQVAGPVVETSAAPDERPLAPNRLAIVDQAFDWAFSATETPSAVVCLVGPSGVGKTELLKRWLKRALAQPVPVFVYGTEPPPPGGFLRDLASRLSDHFWRSQELSFPAEPAAQPGSLEMLWNGLVSRIRTNQPPDLSVVVIDGLEEFESTGIFRSFGWLADLRASCKFLMLTCTPGPVADTLGTLPGSRVVEVPYHESEAAERHLQWVGELRGLPALAAVAQVLWQKGESVYEPAWRLPLWLEIAAQYLTSELVLLRYRPQPVDIQSDSVDRPSADQLRQEAEKLPAGFEPLCAYILEGCEHVLGRGWTQACLGLVAISRRGLRENDLAAIVPKASRLLEPTGSRRSWDASAWATFRRLLPGWFVRRPGWETWDFSHKLLRQAVLNRFCRDAQVKQRLHLFLAYHLQTLPEEDPLRRYELVYHLMAADERARTAVHLSGLPPAPANWNALLPIEQYVLAQADESPNPVISWLASLLLEPTLKPDQTAALCRFFYRDLVPWLKGQLDTLSVRKLLEAARQTMHELMRQQPDRAEWNESCKQIVDALTALEA